MRFSKKIIIVMFAFLFVFTVAVFVLFWVRGDAPDALITCVFGFFATEGGCLALIKTAETKHKTDNENESEDNKNNGFDTDSDSGDNADNDIDNSFPDSVSESENRGEEIRRTVKVGVHRRSRG